MAITITEDGEARGWTTDEDGIKTFPRRWKIQSDVGINESVASDALNLYDPTSILYAPHPVWPWALCRKITGKGSKLGKLWIADAEYSTRPFPARSDGTVGGGGAVPSALQSHLTPANQRLPFLSIRPRQKVKVLEKDVVTGGRVLNSVGMPFDPPVEVERNPHAITWKFWRTPSQLNWPTRSLFQDSVNDADFTVLGKVYPAYSLRCMEYSIDPEWDTGPSGLAFFWAITVIAWEDPDLWKVSILNTGRGKFVGSPAQWKAFADAAGQPFAEPVPIDGGGNVIGPVPPGAFSYVNHDGYFPRAWSGLLA